MSKIDDLRAKIAELEDELADDDDTGYDVASAMIRLDELREELKEMEG